jgi:hypothetical protein
MTSVAISAAFAMLWLDGSTLEPAVSRVPFVVGAEGARLVQI